MYDVRKFALHNMQVGKLMSQYGNNRWQLPYILSAPAHIFGQCSITYHDSHICTYPLWFDSFGNKVVLVHGSGPLAYRGAGLRDLCNGCRGEVLIVNVWLYLCDDGIWNIFLWENLHTDHDPLWAWRLKHLRIVGAIIIIMIGKQMVQDK